VIYDNGHSGYACGFNSKGDVEIFMQATGELGWHFIDLYPAIYKGKEMRRGPAGSARVSETTPATSEVIVAEAGHRPVLHVKAGRQARRPRLCAAAHSTARLAFTPSPSRSSHPAGGAAQGGEGAEVGRAGV
jgi:hypothetical protein